MRNKIKQIIAVFFVMAATAVVWNAPVLAEASTQVELTGTQADIELNKEVTIGKRMVMKLITILHQQKTRDIYLC